MTSAAMVRYIRTPIVGIWSLALLTGLTLAAPLGWPFELTTHFQAQYALLLLPLTLWSLLRKQPKTTTIGAVALALNLFTIAPPCGHAIRPNSRCSKTLTACLESTQTSLRRPERYKS